MKRVASFSTWLLVLSTLFIFYSPIPQAQAAPCTTPSQSSFTETGTTYTIQTFSTKTSNCSWTVPINVSSIRIVLVGGGGGAGFGGCGGGGGAGRVLVSNNSFSVSSGLQLTLTVGDSGTGGWFGPSSSNWTMGSNGETSSVTINGITYSASGGGGGAGGTTATVGLNGGSGGGGTGCTSFRGGFADTSSVSGFTTYANPGEAGTASQYGGGGGGAGGRGSTRNGGDGIVIWGAALAAGGGGWGSGTGGSAGGTVIGGTAGAGTDTKANAGNPGSAGTGSGGGGGNDGGCGRIMIRYVVNSTLSTPTLSATAYKGISLTITVTSTVAGRIRFYALGKQIPQCLSNATSGTSPNFSATCAWTPPTRGYVTLTAVFTPTDSNYAVANTPESKIFVLNRSTKR